MKLLTFRLAPLALALGIVYPAAAGEKSFVGDCKTAVTKDWFVATNWSPAGIPGSDDAVTISGKTVTITNPVSVASLTLASKAALYVYARALADTSPFAESWASAMAALWANRLVVSVSGALTVPSGCTVYPNNDKLTGALVAFEVGSADIAGSFNATGLGWGWTALGSTTLPDGAYRQHGNGGSVWYYSFAFGVSAKGETGQYWAGGCYGASYGYAAAPFMPGSQSSIYNSQINPRGGGSIVIHAKGAINLTGSLVTNGNRNGQNGGCSGGSVWLFGTSITRSTGSKITANGDTGLNGNQGQGQGGRICLAEGVSAADLATLIAGTVPDTVIVEPLSTNNVTATGAQSGSKKAADGTVRQVWGNAIRTKVTVQKNVDTALSAEGVVWGATNVTVGTAYAFSAPEFGYDTSNSLSVRYAFTGYVISNLTGEVVRKNERSVSITPVASEGPYTLTWLMGPRETRTHVDIIGDGAGTVTESEETHGATFDVWALDTETFSLTAAASAGSTFVQFASADLEGGYSEDATISLAASTPHVVSVNFANGRIKRAFIGSTVADLTNPLKWSPAGLPNEAQEAYFTNKTISATSFPTYAKLVISGGTFKIGGSGDPRTGFTFSVADELEIAGGAKVYFYAKEFADLTPFTNRTTAATAIWTNRSIVAVGGKFSVKGGAIVYPVNDPVTGTPVVFEVGSFDLASDGTLNATGSGWQWRPTGSRTFPEGVKKSTGAARIDSGYYNNAFTFAFGVGGSYTVGAAHGGYGAAQEVKYRTAAYGYRAAPFLPGSPGGAYANSVWTSWGGGTVCVISSGAANLCGKIYANASQNNGYSGAAGGGVWIVAGEVVQGDALTVQANGSGNGNSNHKPGGGGRVCFTSGVVKDSAAFADLVAGNEPDALAYDTLAFSGLSVKGATCGGTVQSTGGDGTALSVYDVTAFETLTVQGAPVNAVSTGVAYGDMQVLPGAKGYAVTDWGYDPSDKANVRYRCGGWVVSNATTQVASGLTSNAVFTVAKGEGPYTLTWCWTDREARTVVTPAPALGVIRQGGAALTVETVFWVRDNAALTLEAVPNEGCELTKWQGAPRGSEIAMPLVLSGADPHTITAYFHDSASTTMRYWKKGASGSFYTAANWDGGVVPGYGDTAVISNGTCTATEYLKVAGLVVTNGASFTVSGADEVIVTGDALLAGSSVTRIYARAIDETHTFATGATRVKVGGELRIEGTAVLYPHSETLRGGSVRFDVHDFFLASGASVNADNLGWAWNVYTGTPQSGASTFSDNGINYQTFAIGRGWSYGNGGSYGCKADGSSGPAYGWANAPIHPGSPSGIYLNITGPGGGLARIHAFGKSTVNGTITADGNSVNVYGGPSGGGIWLTARQFAFGEASVLRARGGTANYWSNGSGGRIAIGQVVDAGRLAELAETGAYTGIRKNRIRNEATFRATVGNASMTIDVHSRPNSSQGDKPGTFVFLYGIKEGTMLFVR